MSISEENIDKMHSIMMDPNEMWEICLDIGKELREQVLRARETCKNAGDPQNGPEAADFLDKAKKFYAHSRLLKMFKKLCEQIDEQAGPTEEYSADGNSSDMN